MSRWRSTRPCRSKEPAVTNEWIPRPPQARVVVVSPGGATLFEGIAAPGQTLELPGGSKVKVVGIDWYSRLSIVDDPTIPLIYAAMVIAAIGLTMTVTFRQRLLVATALRDDDGVKLAMNARLWRNVSTSTSEIQSVLAKALGGDEKGSVT
jgi:hypothetical protein